MRHIRRYPKGFVRSVLQQAADEWLSGSIAELEVDGRGEEI
jgi:hypothetical protein